MVQAVPYFVPPDDASLVCERQKGSRLRLAVFILAALWTSWPSSLLLSSEAQNYSEGGLPERGSDSAREDIPKNMVDPERRREKGLQYINVSAAEYMDMRPVYRVVSEALAEAKR